jgi:hypothetical protein
MNCSQCESWRALKHKLNEAGRGDNEGEIVGECRHFPPRPSQAAGGSWRAFPVTHGKADWCLMFREKPAPQWTTIEQATEVSERRKQGRPKKVDMMQL